ncbi:hypothetical protein L486_02497 [Kwoniella mangroviensis CBS 10435]|uniref:RNA polymerase II-associated protein 3 n=1 Tax=Kwoniella mangroviensis CBS 10435 TaxID=1331196 RepID=A0A1B9IWL5_9TREE|nr:hypothetical protein L486_02497 [Kwoniella mangroviensis CBS 10435]
MSVKVDIGKSDQSRTDGNTSFKKGRWSEAIGHYTNAIIYNPTNPVNYSNRAQAFLKIDKYQDAERDCTTCLSLERNNIKALYRRGLARKGLGKLDEAIEDLQQILKIDKTNETVKSELEELLDTQRNNEIKKSKSRRPITPPPVNSTTSKSTEASIEEIADQTDSIDLSSSSSSSSKPKVNVPDTPKEQNPPNTITSSSFASLKQAREGKKKAFVNSTNVSPSSGSSNDKSSTLFIPTPTSSSKSIPHTDVHLNSSSQPQNLPAVTYPLAEETLSLPTDIDINSTSPGAGLIFLRHLSSSPTTTSVKHNWQLISLYSPEVLYRILINLLEPDNLGLILIALEYGLELDQEQGGKERVKGLLDGLKKSKRWKMNYSMLSHQERTVGEKVWRECGGEGGLM